LVPLGETFGDGRLQGFQTVVAACGTLSEVRGELDQLIQSPAAEAFAQLPPGLDFR
jgi:hypothetical protein